MDVHTINKRRSEDKTEGIISIDAEVFVRLCVCMRGRVQVHEHEAPVTSY